MSLNRNECEHRNTFTDFTATATVDTQCDTQPVVESKVSLCFAPLSAANDRARDANDYCCATVAVENVSQLFSSKALLDEHSYSAINSMEVSAARCCFIVCLHVNALLLLFFIKFSVLSNS